jgi:GxxExxY protein
MMEEGSMIPRRQPAPKVGSANVEYLHSELTEQIIGIFYEVYNEIGCGYLESVYKLALAKVMASHGLCVGREVPTPVIFRGEKLCDFFADLVVNDVILVEVKAVKILEPCHEAQLLNYLRATPIEVGLLLNFGPRPAIRRLAFANERKKISVHQR